MRIRFDLVLDIDPDDWGTSYGARGGELPKNVESYVLNLIQGCPAAEEGGIREVTLKRLPGPRISATERAIESLRRTPETRQRVRELAHDFPSESFARLASGHVKDMTPAQRRKIDWAEVQKTFRQ